MFLLLRKKDLSRSPQAEAHFYVAEEKLFTGLNLVVREAGSVIRVEANKGDGGWAWIFVTNQNLSAPHIHDKYGFITLPEKSYF